MSILRVSWSEPSAGQEAAEEPSFAIASARATPPPDQHAPARPVSDGAGRAARCRPREPLQYRIQHGRKRTQNTSARQDASRVLSARPGGKELPIRGGAGLRVREAGPSLQSRENGLRLEKERRRDLEHGVRKGADLQLRVPSGALGRSSSRRGGGAASFGLLRRESHSQVRVRN